MAKTEIKSKEAKMRAAMSGGKAKRKVCTYRRMINSFRTWSLCFGLRICLCNLYSTFLPSFHTLLTFSNCNCRSGIRVRSVRSSKMQSYSTKRSTKES